MTQATSRQANSRQNLENDLIAVSDSLQKCAPGASPWFRTAASLLLLAVLTACGGGGGAAFTSPTGPGGSSGPVANTFFGMNIHSLSPGVPWPSTIALTGISDTVHIGGLRLWDDGTGWADINTAPDVFNFSHMDSWLAEAQANNADVLYDLARTPTWASSQPTDSTCSYVSDGGPGQCDPPYDLNGDGSGADAVWIDWVTAVVSRYKGQIKYYEIWNEWNIANFWNSNLGATAAQLVRMTQDARCVIEGPPAAAACNPNSSFPGGTGLDPNARILNPAAVGAQSDLNAVEKNTNNFLNAQAGGMGPASFIDIVGFHCYVSTKTVGDYPVPEDVLTVISDLDGILPAFGLQNEPVFCTEGGWGEANLEGFTDPDLQAGFLARYYLLQNPQGVSRIYWYAWDSTSTYFDALWSAETGVANGVPSKAATAYAEVYKWITGATPSGPCSANGTVWTCAYTRSGGYQALAVWDGNTGSGCYTAGAPTCSTFTIQSKYTVYRDLSGNEPAVPGSTISLTAKPILLETSALP
jgi:polysaccharide biosynthesis protein PslG